MNTQFIKLLVAVKKFWLEPFRTKRARAREKIIESDINESEKKVKIEAIEREFNDYAQKINSLWVDSAKDANPPEKNLLKEIDRLIDEKLTSFMRELKANEDNNS
jgi:hypothetical protein